MAHPDFTNAVLNSVGQQISDAEEETFLLFSHDIPSQNLGMVDEKAATISVEVAGREYDIRQSTGLLMSQRSGGTTGAVLWKVTPVLATWLADTKNALWTNGLLSASMTLLELGCGSAGLIGLAMSPLVSRYILTDQDYVMKLLRDNVNANTRQMNQKPHARTHKTSKGAHRSNLDLVTLDWEHDSVQQLRKIMKPDEDVNFVILSDCIYNEYLIRPLAQVCMEVCALSRDKPTVLLIAQQLRSHEVFQLWMQTLMSAFKVWRVADSVLPSELRASSGYVVHLAILRQDHKD